MVLVQKIVFRFNRFLDLDHHLSLSVEFGGILGDPHTCISEIFIRVSGSLTSSCLNVDFVTGPNQFRTSSRYQSYAALSGFYLGWNSNPHFQFCPS